MSVARKVELVVVIVSMLATGCLLGPDYKRPPAPVAVKWTEAGNVAVAESREEYRDWWNLFNDPVLTGLIQIAYQQNLTLMTAGVRVLQARAELGMAIGEFYPQQQLLTAGVNYNRIPISLPYNIIHNTYWADQFGAQASWELDVWGKIRRGIESADSAFLASVANYDDVLVTLTGDVASTYVQIRTQELQLKIARENVVRQRKAYNITLAKFQGGAVSKRDVYQAQNVLGSTEATIPQLSIQLAESQNALSVLLGMPPGNLSQLLAGSSEIPTAPTEVAAGIPADLLLRRPDLRKAELDAQAQCAQIGFAKADLLPTFSLIGNVGTLSSNIGSVTLSDVFTAKSLLYSVGPTLQWNILNYGQITNNVRVQDAKFQELQITYQNDVLQAQQEVENGLVAFVKSREEVVFLEESVKGAEGALRIAMLQYQQGILDFTTVLIAEENLYQAQNSLAIARGDIPLGLIATYRALGGGWQIREGHDFVPAETRDTMSKRTYWGGLLSPDKELRPKAPELPGPKDVSPNPGLPEW